jgi:hypothetical protein
MLSPLSIVAMSISILVVSALPAMAVERRGNPPEVIVWGFLGLCALIIVSQMVPLVRNLRKQATMTAEQAKDNKIQQL